MGAKIAIIGGVAAAGTVAGLAAAGTFQFDAVGQRSVRRARSCLTAHLY